MSDAGRDTGTEYSRVTHILSEAGIIDDTPFSDEAAVRGSLAHEAIALAAAGRLDESDSDPILAPYVSAWRTWRADMGAVVRPESIEMRICSPAYGFRGRIDMIASIHGVETLIDVKTGAPRAWHPIQTAGYALALPVVMARAALYLRPDATYRFERHTDNRDMEVFRAAVVVARWKNANKRRCEHDDGTCG